MTFIDFYGETSDLIYIFKLKKCAQKISNLENFQCLFIFKNSVLPRLWKYVINYPYQKENVSSWLDEKNRLKNYNLLQMVILCIITYIYMNWWLVSMINDLWRIVFQKNQAHSNSFYV